MITKDSEAWDDIGVPALVESTESDLVSSYHLALLRPDIEQISGAFLYRTLSSVNLADQLYVRANGVTRFGLSHHAIKSVWLPLATLTEQTAIVRFLDHADRRIRRCVRAKEKLIALLKEQKQAIIHQAVTGRIDVRTGQPYPTYKSSGVDWMGDVPTHWKSEKIKSLARPGYKTFVDGDWIESPYIASEGIRLIQTGNIGVGEYKEKGFRYISGDTFTNLKCTEVKPGDILICRLGEPVARACLAPELGKRMITSVDVCILKNRADVHAEFLIYGMSSRPYLDWVGSLVRGSTRDRVSRSMLGTFELLLPPFPEQDTIVGFLDGATGKIDDGNGRVQSEIELLHEYRTRLIADVVTGKLDVREAAAALPEVDPLADDDDVGDGLGADETPAFDDDQEPAEVVG